MLENALVLEKKWKNRRTVGLRRLEALLTDFQVVTLVISLTLTLSQVKLKTLVRHTALN